MKIIKDAELRLHVLDPHGDGAVDVVRINDKEEPIDKSFLPQILKAIFMINQDQPLRIAMLGDGTNDVPAMAAPGVIGVTFTGCDPKKVIQPVLERGGEDAASPGIVTRRTAPDGGGPAEGILRLAREFSFFGDQKEAVSTIVRDCFPEVCD